jgi:hypothetical protein
MCSSEYTNGEYPNIIFMEYSTIKGHEIPLSKNWKFVSFHIEQNN